MKKALSILFLRSPMDLISPVPELIPSLRRQALLQYGILRIVLLLSLCAVASITHAQWENLADFTDAEPAPISDEEPPANRVELKQKEFFRAVNDPELKADIEANYAAIQVLMSQGNAFNLELSELYFSYALLLREAGRVDEAVKALVDAMHIQKANYGLYDARHKSLLKLLFDFNFERQQYELAEEYLGRLLLLEEQLGEKPGDETFAMLVQMGHYYLDAYQWSSTGTDAALENISIAARYFRKCLEAYQGSLFSERLLPYGEYTYAEYYLSNELAQQYLRVDADLMRTRSRLDTQLQEARMNSMLSRKNAAKALERFLKDAHTQQNQSMRVRALISIGDLKLMTGRAQSAKRYYAEAWQEAQTLSASDPQRSLFSELRKLPNYMFSKEWNRTQNPNKTRMSVPIKVWVNSSGRVMKLEQASPEGPLNDALYSRARRTLWNYTFRPRMVNGEFVDVEGELFDAEILVRNSWLERRIEKAAQLDEAPQPDKEPAG